jgi:outer membrane receptor protein involved in Fe transport
MTLAARLFPTIPLAALLLAGAAYADTRASAVVSADAGYGENPFFGAGTQDNNSGTLTIAAAPRIEFVGPTSNLDLNGRVEHSFFTTHYPDVTNWSLGANAGVALGPRTNLKLGASYASNVNTGIATQIQPLPPEDPAIPLPDPSATENGGLRTKTLTGTAGIDSQISLRDTVNVSAALIKVDYQGPGSSSYTTYSGSAGLSHAFSDRMSGGFSATYAKTDYDQAAFGSFKAFSPALNMTFKLAPHTTLNVSAGATFNNETRAAGGTTNSTHFSGSASLCHAGSRSNLCASASRSVGATSLAGSSTITQIAASYSYKLTTRSSISLGGSYSQTKSIGTAATPYEFSYLGSSATYTHQLKERLSLTVNARYTDPIKSTGGNRRQSFYGGVGLSYRFGR